MEQTINENTILRIGFLKQYENKKGCFYTLPVTDKVFFTIDEETMTLSIQLKGYGHIQKLEHIKTIEQIHILYFTLTDKNLSIKI